VAAGINKVLGACSREPAPLCGFFYGLTCIGQDDLSAWDTCLHQRINQRLIVDVTLDDNSVIHQTDYQAGVHDVLAAHLPDGNDGKDLLISAAGQVTAAVEGFASVAHQHVFERVFQGSH
jgi:hypothetical protein